MAKNHPSHVAKPVYPGGNTALKKFVAQHLRYPDAAWQAEVEGTVTVRYSLDYRGKVVDAKVKKSLGHGCDEEALRVVRLLRFEVPQNRKKKVRIHQNMNIHFRLPKKNKAKASRKAGGLTASPRLVEIQYSSVPKLTVVPEKQDVPSKKAGSYTYTINW